MIPIKYHLPAKLAPDKPTRLQIENTANIPDAFDHVAVLPDVHSKIGRKCPTGTVLAAKSIYPQIMDTAPNCGMRVISTPWKESDLDENKIAKLFTELVKHVPTRTYIGSYVSYETVIKICRYGAPALLEYLNEDLSDAERMFGGGSFFAKAPEEAEVFDSIPKLFLRFAAYRLGILGEAGNHFLDLMKIEEVLDHAKAKALNIEQGQYVFLMHTGSGILGQYASYFFTPKREEHLSMKIITNFGRQSFSSRLVSWQEMSELQRQVKTYREKIDFFRIEPDSPIGKAYLTAHRASANYGFANRSMIAFNIKKAIKSVFNESPNLKTICDMPHIFVDQEDHYGSRVWVHRNGASRGFGPSRMSKHPVFSKTGEPGVLAGSMSTPSYLVAATDSNESTFFSINHGAGKSKKVSDAAPKTKEQLYANMKKQRVPLFNARSRGVVGQASDYYKDIDEILAAAQGHSMVAPVAKMRPVAVLMA